MVLGLEQKEVGKHGCVFLLSWWPLELGCFARTMRDQVGPTNETKQNESDEAKVVARKRRRKKKKKGHSFFYARNGQE